MHYIKAKSLLTKWNGMNIYRGCTHGCIYCDSRSKCYRITGDFEDTEVKVNASEMLENILRSKRKKIMIGTVSMSDPYQPCEEKLMMTKKCLELIDKYSFGATVITKSDRVLRDIDTFDSINQKGKSVLQMTLTIADDKLSRLIEPNVCTTSRRYEVLKEFQKRGIPTVVWLTPLLPFIGDTEENFDKLMEYCADSGVKGIICFYIGMTLREGNREYYYEALNKIFPGMTEKYIRKYGNSYNVISDNNDKLMEKFHNFCNKYGIIHNQDECFEYIQEYPQKLYEQLNLFDFLKI
ncbi:MAG: radical SAM protein [Firmicutes bacterium]|nr:radical SAM protein [Bacillota bacterium]